MVLSTDFPFEVATKVSLADNKLWNYSLLGFITIVCLGALLSWPIAAWIRTHYQRPLMLSTQQKRLRLTTRIAATLQVIFLACWICLFLSADGEPLFDAHLDPLLRLFQVIGWLSVLGAVASLYAVVKTWKSPGEWWLSRLGDGLVAIAAISFLWFPMHWRLLHFSLRY